MSMLEGSRARTAEMVEALGWLVSAESPTEDLAACAACAREVSTVGRALLGEEPEAIVVEGRTHLRWAARIPDPVVLLCHLDTVWPLGTLARLPFAVTDGIATGPGCFDMKAGIVQGLFAMAALPDRSGVELLVTADEETGSATSRALIEDAARRARAVLVLEAAEAGAVKIARKGVSMFTVRVQGKAAHAGLEPERGVNALVELAHQVHDIIAIGRPEEGTTVTPTVARAGTTTNTVPEQAEVRVDVRATSVAEQERVEAALRALRPRLAGAAVLVEGGANRPPLERSASADLFKRARRAAAAIGIGELAGVAVGGGSDGNFTAALGTPTLDGLGAVGAGAHAEHEHVVVAAMPERAALVAALLEDLLGGGDESTGERSAAGTRPRGRA